MPYFYLVIVSQPNDCHSRVFWTKPWVLHYPHLSRAIQAMFNPFWGSVLPWQFSVLHSLVSTVTPSHPSFGLIQMRLRVWVPATPNDRHVFEHALHHPKSEKPAAKIQLELVLIYSSYFGNRKLICSCKCNFGLKIRGIYKAFIPSRG